MDDATMGWLKTLDDAKLVEVLVNAGRIPWNQRDYWLELMPNLRAPRPEGVTLPLDLAQKILVQHEMAAESLVDSRGDIHREIVAELERHLPQKEPE